MLRYIGYSCDNKV